MSQFGNRVNTTTKEKYLPKAMDVVLNSNVFAEMMLSKARKWSGTKLKKSVKVSKNTTGKSFNGFDILSTNATDNRIQIEFEPKFYHIDVAIAGTELSVNNTEDGFIDLAKAEIEGASQDMADDIGSLFYGDGLGNDGKDFQGLGAIVSDSGTYGGKSRTTYTGLQAQVRASGGTLTIAKMLALYNDVSSGDIHPDFALCGEDVYALVETLLAPMQTQIINASDIKNGMVVGTGAREIYYKGMPIKADEKATAGTLFFLNSNYLDWYALPVAMTEAVPFTSSSQIEGNNYEKAGTKNMGFSWSKWIIPSNQNSVVAHIYLGGQLVSWNPRRLGKLTGITNI